VTETSSQRSSKVFFMRSRQYGNNLNRRQNMRSAIRKGKSIVGFKMGKKHIWLGAIQKVFVGKHFVRWVGFQQVRVLYGVRVG
jgi:hypothetical protein